MRLPVLLGRYFALEPGDRWLLARAFFDLGLADASLRLGGYRRALERAERLAPDVEANVLDADAVRRARRYARWLEKASRYHIVRARCLHRSLTLHRWLRRDGIASDLRIGVRKDGGALKAHAWVEIDGHVVNDGRTAVAQFTPLPKPVHLAASRTQPLELPSRRPSLSPLVSVGGAEWQ